MYSRNQVLAALATVGITSVNAAMGPALSTGPVASNSFIREATSTLILPKGPSGGSTDAITSLWVGMGTSNGDLIQSIADNWQQSDWTMYAHTLMKTSGLYTTSMVMLMPANTCGRHLTDANLW